MINVDSKELDKFNQIASQWWDPQGPLKTLHEMNPIRLKFILDSLSKSIANPVTQQCQSLKDKGHIIDKRILDIGCGGGILTESLAKLGAKVTGIDASEAAIKIAAQHANHNNLTIDYFQTTAEQFIPIELFDIVTCMELLEHVPDPISVIQSCARLVKPNGYVFFSTLNRSLKSFLFAIVGAEYILNLLPKGTHDYSKFIRPSELQKMALQAGLSIYSISGLEYNPLFKECSLSNNVDVNYLVCCVMQELSAK